MKPNKNTYIYIVGLFVLASISYGFLIYNFRITDIKLFLFWTILTIIVESLLIPLVNNSIGVSVGSAINLAAIVVGGPLLGTTSAFVGLLLRCPKIPDRGYIHLFNTPLYKTLFNISQSIVVTTTMGIAYLGCGGKIGGFFLRQTILVVIIGTIYNTIIISGLMSLLNEESFIRIWYGNMKGTFASSLAIGIIGGIIALAFIGYGYGAVILFFGPLLLARYSFKLYIETRNLYLDTIQAFNSAMEAKDPYTSGHASRVEEYAVKLAEACGMSMEKIHSIRNAAILHDIGKIGVNDNILNKKTRLTDEEYEEIKVHPILGADIINEVDFLKKISCIVKSHHERYDGKGYPDGLAGNEVPFESYVLSIADSYDAMTSDRPYRKSLSKEEAIKEIIKNSGTQFHPDLAQKFVEIISG